MNCLELNCPNQMFLVSNNKQFPARSWRVNNLYILAIPQSICIWWFKEVLGATITNESIISSLSVAQTRYSYHKLHKHLDMLFVSNISTNISIMQIETFHCFICIIQKLKTDNFWEPLNFKAKTILTLGEHALSMDLTWFCHIDHIGVAQGFDWISTMG